MKELTAITIPGNPVALKRHRTTKSGHRYDPSQNDKADFLAKCMAERPAEPFDCPLRVEMVFYFRRPKNHYRTNGELKKGMPTQHTKTPDIDNLAKFVFDSLNGIFWTDDKIISLVIATKVYSEVPRIKLSIERIGDNGN